MHHFAILDFRFWIFDWNPKSKIQNPKFVCGSSSVGRASAFQAECREFESRLPLQHVLRPSSSGVERILGKDEVSGSNPDLGSIGFVDLYLDRRRKRKDEQREIRSQQAACEHWDDRSR